jgi:DNA-binding NtrC family response regulator
MTSPHQVSSRCLSVSVFDDEACFCELIKGFLSAAGCSVQCFTDARKGLAAFQDKPTDIVITDINMPGGLDGLALLKVLKEQSPLIEVILMTGSAGKNVAIQALRLGAFDFLEKPITREDLVATVKRTVRYRAIAQESEGLVERLSLMTRQESERWGIEAFVGKSAAIRKTLLDIRLLQRKPNTSVLITGESGTGKELVARAIHYGSDRSLQPFVAVNCAAVPPELADSMLFGHVRGAFTGAAADRKGCFETADRGTVFLDEIGDMPLIIQAKLLRVLEDKVVVPVGATQGLKINVRIVSATNASLESKIATGAFRSDLFYRLGTFPFILSPLREHAEDIPLLARHFALKLSSEMGLPCPDFKQETLNLLEKQFFPGNVRELKNRIERALIECAGKSIAPEHLHFQEKPLAGESKRAEDGATASGSGEIPVNLRAAERLLARRVLAKTNGNVSAAAQQMGISRAKFYRLTLLTP